MRKLQVTLEIDVDDLPKEQRKELAREQECKPRDLPSLKDTEASEVARVIEGLGMEGMSEELFAGSDVYVRFTDARVVKAAWVYPAMTIPEQADDSTLYLDRTAVRAIIIGVADEHVHVTEGILADIDQLPILTAADIAGRAQGLPAEWVEFYQKHHPTVAELQELVDHFSNRSLVGVERLALPPLRAREEIARATLSEIAAACEERTHPGGPVLISHGHLEDLRAIAAKARGALSRTAGQATAADMQAFSASEACCYLWPEDTDEHKALRAAYIKGAASVSTAGQEWRDISSAPKNGSYVLTYTPSRRPPFAIFKWMEDEILPQRSKWVSDDLSWYVKGPTHWMPLPAPPVAEPIVAEKSEVK